ncbi:MAG: hypothetical protein JNL13_07360 [Chitinophagaceae bacterium]|nr:hypothetical protein [Chitinophagaceae bacterium]
MKKLGYFSGIVFVLMFSLGLSSCYVGYYDGPRYRSGPHYRPHYHHGHGHGHGHGGHGHGYRNWR